MFRPLWLRQLLCRLFGRRSRNARNAVRPAPIRRRVRLDLEGLEDRLTPSSLSAINTADTSNHASALIAPLGASATSTSASSATAPFSSSTQTVNLSATVTSSGGTVNEGSVTFTILQGTTVIGTATSGPVSDGQASVSYSLPGGTAAGTYTIEADYSDDSGSFAASSDNTQTLAVGSATSTSASSATAPFSSSTQT
ncbi:MAG TPA: Ig-like domain-containing protein, partial [Gemmataceae bacterium]